MNPAPEPMRLAPWNPAEERPLDLAMQELRLSGTVLPVGARLLVRHVFRSAESRPIEVVYPFALPRDAAIRRFRVVGEGFSVRSELHPVREAERRYERALDDGHLAALARVHRDGIVNLAVGNLRPGETVAVIVELVTGVEPLRDGFRFRFPFTLAPGYHPRATAAATAPGEGEILLPDDEFDGLLLPAWKDWADGLHRVDLDLAVLLPEGEWELASPSHPVTVEGTGRVRVRLATADGDVPDRDLVLDARTGEPGPLVLGGTDRSGRGRFVAAVPSRTFGEPREDAPRRIVFVLDRSGSMQGRPLAAAKRAIRTCLAGLREGDAFAIVAFDTGTTIFPRDGELAPGTPESVREAAAFLDGIDAGGGTEILRGLRDGAGLLGDGGGNLLLVTDGEVYGSEDVVAGMARRGVRVHALGIGSAARDRFLEGLARATGGTSRAVGPREDVEGAILELFAATGAAVAEGLRVEVRGLEGGRLDLPPASTLLAGTHATAFGSSNGTGEGKLVFAWQEGPPPGSLSLPLSIPDDPLGETLALLAAARKIADLEAAATDPDDVREELEAIGRETGLASRAMALVAVVERAGDTPGEPPLTRVVPVGMPQDVEPEAYFQEHACLAPPGFAKMQARVVEHADAVPRHVESEPEPPEALLHLEELLRRDRLPDEPLLHELLRFLDTLRDPFRRRAFRHHLRRLREALERTARELTRQVEAIERLAYDLRRHGGDARAAFETAGTHLELDDVLVRTRHHLCERLELVEHLLHRLRDDDRRRDEPGWLMID